MHIFQKEAFGSLLIINSEEKISENILDKIILKVETFEEKYSRFRKGNWLYNLNNSGFGKVDKEFLTMFNFGKKLFKLTNGLFDMTILPDLENIGYGIFEEKLEKKAGMDDIKIIGDVIFLNGAMIEFGGVGKGFMVDIIYNFLEKSGYRNFIVNFGGDLKVNGKHIIKLENPLDNSKIIGEIELENMAICSSSGQKRKFGKNHHIINPKTKKSANDKSGIFVTHKSCMIADGFSTALFVMEKEEGRKVLESVKGLEMIIV